LVFETCGSLAPVLPEMIPEDAVMEVLLPFQPSVVVSKSQRASRAASML
jgi:hypothetical protein